MLKDFTYSQQDRNINAELYAYFLENEEEDGWDDRDQIENFLLLTRLSALTTLPLHGATVLDVGCGTGDMAEFLRVRGIKSYTGIDIFEPAVTIARTKYPFATFLATDFLTHRFSKKFDFVFCSGALSTRLASDNYEMLDSSIKKMWKLAKCGISFNFLTEERNGQYEDDLFLYNTKRVIEICDSVAPNAKFKAKTNRTGDYKEFLQVHIYLYR